MKTLDQLAQEGADAVQFMLARDGDAAVKYCATYIGFLLREAELIGLRHGYEYKKVRDA